MQFALLTLTVLLSFSWSTAFYFNTQCPPNCASRSCTAMFGCTQCNRGYCIRTYRRFGSCVRSCGSGAFCNPVGWCNDCEDNNCAQCSSRRQCTLCERNYSLDRFGNCFRDFGK